MQNISLSANERKTVSQYMLKLSMAYRYNRKVTLLKWSCIIIKNELKSELIKKGLKYFKKLRFELSEDKRSDARSLAELLDAVIEFLSKYNSISLLNINAV